MTLRTLSLFAVALVLPAAALCQRDDAPALPYKAVDVWPLPSTSAVGAPGPWNFGQVSSVAINANGNILVLHRGAYPILEFDANGKFLRSFGESVTISDGKVFTLDPPFRTEGRTIHSAVYGPAGCTACGAHSIRVDPQGNIWVIDASGQVIYEMDQQGRVLLQLGTKGVSGTSQSAFNLPTDVAFAPDGSIYVSDGYANERVVKFSRDGKYLMEWGKRGSGAGEFLLPHNLAIDAQGRVYVTDRENQRIEVFDANGKFLKEWPSVGGVSALFMAKDQHLWAGGAVYDLDGRLVGRLPGLSEAAHGMAVSPSGDVYLAFLSGSVKKFVK